MRQTQLGLYGQTSVEVTPWLRTIAGLRVFNTTRLAELARINAELADTAVPDLAMLSVALRELRNAHA